jgi:hypothetical protein
MRWINPLAWAVVGCAAGLLSVIPVAAATVAADQAEYTKAINAIIVNCSKKQCLNHSRSAHLRRCAEKASRKAAYLRRNQARLVEAMMAEKLPLKTYKIERFVNARFSTDLHSKR